MKYWKFDLTGLAPFPSKKDLILPELIPLCSSLPPWSQDDLFNALEVVIPLASIYSSAERKWPTLGLFPVWTSPRLVKVGQG
jgi:hypothetical protein